MCVMYQDLNINCGEQIKNGYVLYVYISTFNLKLENERGMPYYIRAVS